MSPENYRAELAGFVHRLRVLALQPADALSRTVPACAGWTLEQLFGHLGSIERWAADVVRSGKYVEEAAPPATGAAAWFLEGAAPFLEVMTALDPGAECWNFGPPPRTAGFWLRRQAHEHAIHLVDACQACGLETPDFGTEFMLDGVDEVLTMFTPRQMRLERMPQPAGAVAFHVPGSGTWKVGTGQAAASVTAPVSAMYLGLWGRSKLEESAVIEGDADLARQVLRGPLTP